jgi:hypothetical protein
MSNKISLDEMRERVGRAFYGDAWIDKVPDRDWQLIQRYSPERKDGIPANFWDEMVRPCPPELIKDLAAAMGLHRLSCAQLGTADEWLRLYGFLQPSFDREEFEAAFTGPLGKAIAQLRADLLPAKTIIADLSADISRAAALEEKYRAHAEDARTATGRWPTTKIDDAWAKINGVTRDRGRELRRKFREELAEFDELRKGGKPPSEPGLPK